MGAFNGLCSLENCCFETKGLGDEVYIVVYGFGDADNREFQAAFFDFFTDGESGLHGTVAAYDEKNTDIGTLKCINDIF